MSGRERLLRLLTGGLSLLLVFAAGETVVRSAGPAARFVDTAVDTRSPSVRHRPNFRDRSWPGVKPAGRFRVLVLGDSFAWGHGVHTADAWPLRLERELRGSRPELDLEVVNWSHTGWNTRQAWTSVRPWLETLWPDLVIVGFTLNDAEPDSSAERDRRLEPLHRRQPATALSRALHARSAFYRLFWERLENRRQRRAFIDYYHGLYQGPTWRACRAAMAELRAACGEIDAPLLLVIFPIFDAQLDDAYPYRRLHNKTASAARELDIRVLDLLPAFRGMDARRLAVTPFVDPHPSEIAHRIAADRVTVYLVREGVLRQRGRQETGA